MKLVIWALLVAVGVLVLAPAAQAQGELPPTAGEAVKEVALVLGIVAGLLGAMATEAVKRLPWFTEGEKTKIGGWAAQLVAGVAAILSSYLVTWLAAYADDIDDLGLWRWFVIGVSWLLAEVRYQYVAWRRSRSLAAA